jgi:hypothetical protein
MKNEKTTNQNGESMSDDTSGSIGGNNEPEWLRAALAEYYNGVASELDLDSANVAVVGCPATDRWSDAALAAEYVLAMQESVPIYLSQLSTMPFAQFVAALAREARIPDLGPVWRWLGLSVHTQFDVASAREFGKLAASLHLPLENVLLSVRAEMAQQWDIEIPQPVTVYRRDQMYGDPVGPRTANDHVSSADTPALEELKDLRPFQLMDLRLIVAEIRASYGDFE